MRHAAPACALAVLLLASPALGAQAEFIDLGSLGTGAAPPSAEGCAVSGDGGTAVGMAPRLVFNSTIGAFVLQDEAFRWRRASGMTSLGTTPTWFRGAATAVSPDGGTVAGWRQAAGSLREPFLWTSGGGQVSFAPPGQGDIVALTDRGEVVVYNTPSLGGARWTAATGSVPIDGAPALGFPFFLASGVSADGSVVVGTAYDSNVGYSRAAIHVVGAGTTLLELPIPWVAGIGDAISADGTTVVGTLIDSNGSQLVAFRWTAATGVEGLGPGGSFVSGIPVGVSADGQTIALGQGHAAIWTPATGVVDLAQHLTSLGAVIPPNAAGYPPILEVRGLSADGNALVGARDVLLAPGFNWTVHAWVAYLTPRVPGELGAAYCQPAVPNSTGAAASIRAAGSIVAADDEVELVADGLPAQTVGILLNSMTQGFTAHPGGSAGDLCLGGAVGRHGGAVVASGAAGRFTLSLDLSATPTPTGAVPVLAGQTWNFQFWYRDANPAPTSNFSGAVSIGFQ